MEERAYLLLESFKDYKTFLLHNDEVNEIYKMIKLHEVEEKIELLKYLMTNPS